MPNVRLQEHKDHLQDLINQRNKQYAIGNYRKVKDLTKGIRRIKNEIRECEMYLGTR